MQPGCRADLLGLARLESQEVVAGSSNPPTNWWILVRTYHEPIFHIHPSP